MPRNIALAVAVARDGRPRFVIAGAAGVDASTFSGIVTGRVQPTARARACIARALGATEASLFEHHDAEQAATG